MLFRLCRRFLQDGINLSQYTMQSLLYLRAEFHSTCSHRDTSNDKPFHETWIKFQSSEISSHSYLPTCKYGLYHSNATAVKYAYKQHKRIGNNFSCHTYCYSINPLFFRLTIFIGIKLFEDKMLRPNLQDQIDQCQQVVDQQAGRPSALGQARTWAQFLPPAMSQKCSWYEQHMWFTKMYTTTPACYYSMARRCNHQKEAFIHWFHSSLY